MKLNNKDSVSTLTDAMLGFFQIQEYKDILQFAVQDVDLSEDVSAEKSHIDLENYPYMVQPLANCTIENNIRKQVVIAFPEQFGKTAIQMIVALHSLVYNSLQAIITYPSLELAVETSTVKFIPLFKKIQQFKQQIEKPFAIRSDRLKLSNAIVYWQGAGTKIVSKSAKLVLGDECAVWQTPNQVNNIIELKKRTRSYKECLQLFVSTPSYKEDIFWREWLQGSQGYYYLRCKGCGKLTIRSCDIHNLQFDTVYNDQLKQYVAIRGSERLICPDCRHQHPETDRQWMVKNGGYVHKFPERKTFLSYQAGCLASLLNVHSWSTIADVQLASGKSSTLEQIKSFDNSYRGLPYQERDHSKQDQAALKKHYYKPSDLSPDEIQAVIISADTQDTFSPYTVVALTKSNNYYVLEIGRLRYLWLDDDERKIIDAENKRNEKPPETTLLDLLDKEFYGIKPLMMLVDLRGHRSDEVKAFSKMRKNIILYGGTSLKYQKFKASENVPKLFLCDAKKFQAQMIFMLHFQQSKQSNYLYLPETISETDTAEILAFQPDKQKRNGNLYENWVTGDKVHDIGDCVKMALAAFQIAVKIYRKDKFRFGVAKILNGTKKAAPKKAAPKKAAPRSPLFRR